MSEWIYGNIVRGGTNTIASNIRLQVDKMEAKEAMEYQGADPYFTYRMYTRMLPTSNPVLVLQGDHVIDQKVIDPITNTNRTYVIISDPTPAQLMMSWRWIAIRSTRGGA